MSYPISRSMNADLSEGMTDGKYRKVVNDRSNAEPLTYGERRDLYDRWYGIHESQFKIAGDGSARRTPNTVATPPALPL